MQQRCRHCGADLSVAKEQPVRKCPVCSGDLASEDAPHGADLLAVQESPGQSVPAAGAPLLVAQEPALVACLRCGAQTARPLPGICATCSEPMVDPQVLTMPRLPASLRMSERVVSTVVFLCSAILTVGLIYGIDATAPETGLLRDMFVPDGVAIAVPISISFLFHWAVLQSLWRLVWADGQRKFPPKATRQAWLSLVCSGQLSVSAEDLDPLIPVASRESWFAKRLHALLGEWLRSRDVNQAVNFVEQHAVLDAEAVHSSYTLIRLAIWALPILGFIGTVVGISMAVQSFASFLGGEVSDIDSVKQQLVGVTDGLSTAFLTTMHGLVTALFGMFLASAGEKREGDCLTSIDRYVVEELVPSLAARQEGPSATGVPTSGMSRADIAAIRDQFGRGLAQMVDEVQSLRSGLDSLTTSVADSLLAQGTAIVGEWRLAVAEERQGRTAEWQSLSTETVNELRQALRPLLTAQDSLCAMTEAIPIALNEAVGPAVAPVIEACQRLTLGVDALGATLTSDDLRGLQRSMADMGHTLGGVGDALRQLSGPFAVQLHPVALALAPVDGDGDGHGAQ